MLQFIPWQRLAAEMWRSGHLPLWNPLVGCGAPLAANYQTAAFYPLNALYLVTRAEVALSWTVALHVALTGWGMYRWGRAIGLEPFPALVGALALEGGGFLVARATLFPSIALTFAWVPIWLWRAEVLVQRRRHNAPPGRAELRDTLWLGLAIGLGLLAGHAQTAFCGGSLLVAYLVFRTVQEAVCRTWKTKGEAYSFTLRFLALSLISLIVGASLAAVQLLPTSELLLHSQRSTGADYDFAMTYSFWPWRMITFVAPDFFGNPGRGDYWGYATYWEDAGYVGLLPLLLAIGMVVGAVRRRHVRSGNAQNVSRLVFPAWRAGRSLAGFWTASAVMALVLALGTNTPVFPFLFHHVPGFDLFRAPARWLAITSVAVAALAAMGAQYWPQGQGGQQRGALTATVGGALLIGGLTAPRIVSHIPSTFGPATVRLGSMLILVGVLTLLPRRSLWWQTAVTAFIAVDLLTFGWSLVPTVDQALYSGVSTSAAIIRAERDEVRVYWPMDPEHRRLAQDAQYRVKFGYLDFDDFGPSSADYWRGMREAQLPNVGLLDGVASASNFDPLLVGRYADVLEAALEAPRLLQTMGVTHVASDRAWPSGEPLHSRGSVTFYRLPKPLGRAWVVSEARSVAPDETLKALTSPTFAPSTEVVLGKEPPPQSRSDLSSDASPTLSLRDDPNGVTIRASLEVPGYVVLADTWYPGWHVTVDGEPGRVLRANHAFRAVRLGQGTHVVEMTYRPRSVVLGCWVSLVTLAVVLIGALGGVNR
ncbi:MAG: YfhO family protein [Anaerolineae bacterium]